MGLLRAIPRIATALSLLLAGSFRILGASLSVCYAIWSRGWEGWESWNARTGLDEDAALTARHERLEDERRSRR